MNLLERIRERAISPYTNMIATVSLALGMGIAMAQEDELSITDPTNQDVTAEAGSTDFTVTTNIVGDLTVTADTWTEATNTAGWSARFNHTSVVFDNKMWVIGGFDGSLQNDVWNSTDGITWTKITTTGTIWSGRNNHTSVVFDNKIWVIGGRDGIFSSPRQNDVWNSTDGITWTKVTTTGTIWSGREDHTQVVFDGKMWVIGGYNGSARLADVWNSTDGITWTEATADAAWSERSTHTSVVFGGKMWVIGGYDGTSRLADVWNSTDGITWTQVTTTGTTWSARQNHTSVVFDNNMWVIGGWDGSNQDDVWNSTDGATWTEATADAAWSARIGHTSVVFDNKMWVIGGDDNSRQDDVYFSEEWLTASLIRPTLTATYEVNSIAAPRTGTVTVSGGGLTVTVTVTQEGAVPELALSPANRDVTAETGSTNFTVTTNVPSGDLTITDDADWLTVSLSGTTLTADYEANSIAAPRTGTVTVSGGGLTETVTVTQEGAIPELALSPANRDVTAETGSTNFTVTTNVPSGDLTITDDADWLTTELSGTTLTATYEANGSPGSRTGTVTVSGGELTETVTVAQAVAPELVLNPTMQSVTAEAGSTDFTVTTNIAAGDLTVTVNAQEWTEATANAAWSARDDHASVVFDNKMWVIGGSDGSRQNEVWNSTDGIVWTQATADAGWSGRSEHTSVVFDGKIWVIGGFAGTSLQDDVWNSVDGITWTQVATTGTKWSARDGHTSVVFDGKMWVIGGRDGSRLADVWHSTDGITWTQVATTGTIWSGRSAHTSVVFGGKMWVIGGFDGSHFLDDVWSSTDGITWTQATANAAWSARLNHASVVFDNKMWVIGGTDDSDKNDVWHSTDGATWTQATANAAWSARDSHTSVVFDNKMWVIGGTDGSRQNDVYFSGDWLAASLSGATLTADYGANGIINVPRTGTVTISGSGLTATATVTQAGTVPELALSANQDVTAAAGSTDFTVTTNIPESALTVTANTWTEATNATGWSARNNHTSVVFDNKMWVIGGISGIPVQDDVWNSVDGAAWTEATADAPWSGRRGHASVVFGNKMWVIGGNGGTDGSEFYNDVWHSTDGAAWTEATADAPWSGRHGHTSVVFDNKIWVIGGRDGIFTSSRQNDVWNSVDGVTWMQIATTGTTWSARSDHTSVVFGGKMWVIGGAAASSSVLYDDVWHSTDGITWTQATADAGWSGLSDHTSVVFDNKMWVIGGFDGSRQNDVWNSTDGAAWTQTTADAAWSARFSHASVAFDNNMWVIGGNESFSSSLNDVYFSEGDWLAASLSGTTLTADYGANGIINVPRTGTVTISGQGLAQTVTVTQEGALPELALSPANQDVTAEAGSTDFTVTTNLSSDALTITDDADWLTFNLSGSDSPYTLTADYEANGIVAVPRTGTITVSGLALTQTVTVTQAGIPTELALSPSNQDVTVAAGSTDFTVTTNLSSGDLTITDDADWLTFNLSGSDSPYTLTADYEVNSIAAPRTGTVTVSGGGLTETVTVTQAGAAPELALSPANRDVTAETGSTDFTITTNLPAIAITDDADWLTTELSGTTLTATYEANEVAAPRTGIVTVSGGGLTETVTVTQEGAVPELALSPANRDVTAETGSTNFTVTTNVPSGDLTITDDADWLTTERSGTTLTADYEANGIVDVPRTGTVTVSGKGLTETVTVTQAGAPELALSPANRDVTAEAGSTNFTVTTNVPSGDLTITDDADWLTVGLSGTSSPYMLTADYEANSDTSPRTGTVTVSGGGLTETVTVTQAQAGVVFELSLSPAVQSVTSEAGTTDFTVTTNLSADALTTTDDADWLTVSLSGSSSPYTLTATYEANEGTDPRTGTVTISGGGLTETVTVTQAQAGVVFELSLSPAVQSVTSEAGTTDFTVTTSLPADALTTTDDADWLTVSLSGSSSPYTLTATYEANEGTDPRTGTVTISGGGLTETVTVTQAQAGVVFELSLSPAVQSVTNEAGTTDFTVTTNLSADALTTTDDADWMTTELSGTTLTATYEANESTDPRTGTVTVSGGGLTRTVTVEQEGTPLGLEDETILVVYPNPGVAQVTVDFGDMAQGEGKEWMLLDPSGKKVRSGAVARGEATLVINTQGLLSGLYLFQVRVAGHTVSHRVVILH